MKKKLVSTVVTASMLATMVPTAVFATDSKKFADMPDDYSTASIIRAVDNGLIGGIDGKIMPNDSLTRAQMAVILVRAFGADKAASLATYTDTLSGQWYNNDLAKAVKMGIVKGYGNTLKPNDNITREEAFCVLARAFAVSGSDESVLNQFADKDKISSWAKGDVANMVATGLVGGDGVNINAKANISRKDFAVMMDRLVKNYITTAGTYTEIADGSVMVSVPNVTLKDVTITGDLILGDGVGEGDITLDNVKIKGKTVVRGGGIHSIIIKGNSELGDLIVTKVDGNVRVCTQDGASIETTYVNDGTDNVIIEGKNINSLKVDTTITVELRNSDIKNVDVSAVNATVVVNNGSNVSNVGIANTATNAKVIVNGGSSVNKVTSNATQTTVTGSGSVKNVDVKADNATIETKGTSVSVDKDVNGTVAGGSNVESNTNSSTNVTTPTDTGSSSGGGGGSSSTTTYTVTFDADGGSSVASVSVKSGQALGEYASTKVGYVFAGWYNGETKYEASTIITGNVTLTAKWVAKDCNITFDANGGSTVASAIVKYGETLGEAAVIPTKEGYAFNGWYADGTLYTSDSVITSDVTLVADWKEIFTVTFDADGTTVTRNVADGDLVELDLDNPEKQGFIFAGWYNGEELFDITTEPVTGNMTLTAHWVSSIPQDVEAVKTEILDLEDRINGLLADAPEIMQFMLDGYKDILTKYAQEIADLYGDDVVKAEIEIEKIKGLVAQLENLQDADVVEISRVVVKQIIAIANDKELQAKISNDLKQAADRLQNAKVEDIYALIDKLAKTDELNDILKRAVAELKEQTNNYVIALIFVGGLAFDTTELQASVENLIASIKANIAESEKIQQIQANINIIKDSIENNGNLSAEAKAALLELVNMAQKDLNTVISQMENGEDIQAKLAEIDATINKIAKDIQEHSGDIQDRIDTIQAVIDGLKASINNGNLDEVTKNSLLALINYAQNDLNLIIGQMENGEEIQAKLAEIDAKINEIKDKFEKAKEQIGNVSGDIQDRIDTIQAVIDGLKASINNGNLDEVTKNSLLALINYAQNDLNLIIGQMENGEEIQAKLAEIDAKINGIVSAVQNNDDLQNAINEIRKSIENGQLSPAIQEALLQALNKVEENLEDAIRDYVENNADIQDAIVKIKAAIEVAKEASSRIEASITTVKNAQDIVDNINALINGIDKDAVGATVVAVLEGIQNQANSEFEKTLKALKDLNFEVLANNFAGLSALLDQAKDKVVDFDTQAVVESLKAQLNALNDKLIDKLTDGVNNEHVNAAINEIIYGMQAKINDALDELGEVVDSKLDGSRIEKVNAVIKEVTGVLNELDSITNATKTVINGINALIEKINNTNISEDDKANIEEAINNAKASLEEMFNNFDIDDVYTISAKLSALNATLSGTSVSATMDRLQAALDKLNQDVQDKFVKGEIDTQTEKVITDLLNNINAQIDEVLNGTVAPTQEVVDKLAVAVGQADDAVKKAIDAYETVMRVYDAVMQVKDILDDYIAVDITANSDEVKAEISVKTEVISGILKDSLGESTYNTLAALFNKLDNNMTAEELDAYIAERQALKDYYVTLQTKVSNANTELDKITAIQDEYTQLNHDITTSENVINADAENRQKTADAIGNVLSDRIDKSSVGTLKKGFKDAVDPKLVPLKGLKNDVVEIVKNVVLDADKLSDITQKSFEDAIGKSSNKTIAGLKSLIAPIVYPLVEDAIKDETTAIYDTQEKIAAAKAELAQMLAKVGEGIDTVAKADAKIAELKAVQNNIIKNAQAEIPDSINIVTSVIGKIDVSISAIDLIISGDEIDAAIWLLDTEMNGGTINLVVTKYELAGLLSMKDGNNGLLGEVDKVYEGITIGTMIGYIEPIIPAEYQDTFKQVVDALPESITGLTIGDLSGEVINTRIDLSKIDEYVQLQEMLSQVGIDLPSEIGPRFIVKVNIPTLRDIFTTSTNEAM